MSYIQRRLSIDQELQSKSVLLVGARQTGKSSLIRETLKSATKYNLLEADTFLKLQKNPSLIRQQLDSKTKLIVIDEVQKIPEILDEVHLMIEEFKIKFLLTGSSLRRFSHKGINRLGGRLRTKRLLPFSFSEIDLEPQKLVNYLQFGLIPFIYTSDQPDLSLKDYINDYVQGEIIAEGAVRNIPAFSRFLDVAALANGQMINYTKISNDAGVAKSTVIDYFKILTDTMIGYELPSWKETKKRKPISTSKYYFFDTGVVNSLLERKAITLNSADSGALFENFIFHELQCFKNYQKNIEIAYWRSTSNFEVDFIVDNQIAIETKLTRQVTSDDLKSIKALREEKIIKDFYIVCQEDRMRTVDGIKIIPWAKFLEKLWSGQVV